MTTIEQELQALVGHDGYSVRLHDSGYLHVYVYFRGQQIDHRLFARPWKMRRAARYVRRTLREHRYLRDALAREGILP